MRRRVLVRSVVRLLDDGEELRFLAYMWMRHRLMVPYALASAAMLMLVAAAVGIDSWAMRTGIGGAAAALAGTAATDYSVLVLSTEGLIRMRSSKVRIKAIKVIERLPSQLQIEKVGGTVLASDWEIGGNRFTVGKSFDKEITEIKRIIDAGE